MMSEKTVLGIFALMIFGLILVSPFINSFIQEARVRNSIPKRVLGVQRFDGQCDVMTDRGIYHIMYCVSAAQHDEMLRQDAACLKNPVLKVLGICGGNQIAYIRAWTIQPGKCYNLNWEEVQCR